MAVATTSSQVFKQVLIRGGLLVAVIAVLGGFIGWMTSGPNGLASALIGAALAFAFVGLTAASVLIGGRLPLGGFFGVVLGTWLIKIVGFGLTVVWLKQVEFIHGPTLFFTMVASVLGTLTIDALVVLKSRVPTVIL